MTKSAEPLVFDTGKWEQILLTRSPLMMALDKLALSRDPAEAILSSARDVTGVTGRPDVVYMPNNTEKSPLDQLRELGLLASTEKSAKLAREVLGIFQFKCGLHSKPFLLTGETLRGFSNQEAQLALAFIYTLSYFRNLSGSDEAEIGKTAALMPRDNKKSERTELAIAQLGEYASEIDTRARALQPLRNLALAVAARTGKDWSTSFGLDEKQIDGFTQRLTQLSL